MDDTLNGVEAPDDKPRRGRPPKEADTPATVQAWVVMTKTVQMKTGKTRKGELRQVPLNEARQLVARDLAEWTDPRPDLK